MSLLVGFLGACCLFLLVALLAFVAINFFELGFVKAGERVPEMEKGILLVTDVDEHGFEAGFDVLDAALEDAADDVAVADALDGVFLQNAIF